MKKLLLILVLFSYCTVMLPRHGGAIAGGVLGGLALGSIIGSAASRPREVVYVDRGPYRYDPYYDDDYYYRNRDDYYYE